jgi:hypothetical protein
MLAACGDDNSGEPFSAEGTSTDMNAVSASFDSPAMASLSWAAGGIDAVFGAPLVSSSVSAIKVGSHAGLTASAQRIARSVEGFNGGVARSVALAVIPAEVLGKTFEYNTGTDAYQVSERTGAPANGVRFIVYAVNPITQVPVEPLQEAGYADLLDQSTTSTNAVRLQLVSEGVTYVDYGVSGSATATTGLAVVDGFVTNGTTKVDFNLKNSYSDVANGTIGFDYSLDAPTLDVALKYVIGITQVSTAAALADIDVRLTGPHGNVGVNGLLTEGVGELTATVNGNDFAVVTLDDNSEVATITKPDGSALTAPEYAALAAIWGAVLKGLDVFEDLLDPLDNLL